MLFCFFLWLLKMSKIVKSYDLFIREFVLSVVVYIVKPAICDFTSFIYIYFFILLSAP